MSIGPILGSSGLAIMIPPSALGILLAAIARISAGRLLIAITMPGLVMAVLRGAYIITRAYFQPSIAPSYDVKHIPLSEKTRSFAAYVLPLGIIIFLVIGVIYLGVATPSEAAALGAIGCFILAAAYGKLNWKHVNKSVSGTIRVTVMMFMIFMGSSAFAQILAYTGATRGLLEVVMGLNLAPILILIGMQITLLIMGMFMEPLSIMMVAIPIYWPIITALGFNPIWFATIMLLNMEMATTSPPFGLNLYVMKGVAPPDTTLGDIIQAALPFLYCDAIAMALMLGIKAWGQQAATSVSPRPYSVENHELKVELDLEKNYIVASDRLSLKREIKKPAALDLLLRKGLKVNAVQFGEEKLGFQIISEVDPHFYESAVDSEDVEYYNRAQAVRISLSKEAAKQKELLLEISYEGVIKDSSGGADFSREYVTDQITGIIDYRGIYLGAEAIFYPALPGQLFTYSLRVTVPERLRCITEGALQETSVKEGKRTEHWVCVHPMDAFHIVGGQYQVHTVEHNGVQISTYFFPEQVDLSDRYLDACKEYIDLYSELLGPYPFEKFAVVDNIQVMPAPSRAGIDPLMQISISNKFTKHI